jgi:hypothetical protein
MNEKMTQLPFVEHVTDMGIESPLSPAHSLVSIGYIDPQKRRYKLKMPLAEWRRLALSLKRTMARHNLEPDSIETN